MPTGVDIMVIWINFTHSSPFEFADSWSVDVQSCHLLFDHFQFALIHGANIQVPIQYCPLQHLSLFPSPVISTIGCCFALALSLHFSGVISPLFSSSTLGTYWPGEFIFQCLIFLPFHRFLKARILKWFAIPFSSGPRFVRTLHRDLSVLGGLTWRYGS